MQKTWNADEFFIQTNALGLILTYAHNLWWSLSTLQI